MRSLFHIYPDFSHARLEQSYLLILACLNFDHRVDIVLHPGSEHRLQQNVQLLKKWQALPLYGAEDFIRLSELNCTDARQKLIRLTLKADFIA